LSHGTAEPCFLFHLVVEQSPLLVGAAGRSHTSQSAPQPKSPGPGEGLYRVNGFVYTGSQY
jgi:hypothetical protein